MPEPPAATAFPFRPWVRSTCSKAAIWGLGITALLGLVGWYLRDPGSSHVFRAFAVLALYGLVFLLSLLKIWWTAGKPAVILDEAGLSYRLLHTFSPRRIDYDSILASGPRPGTQSHRIVHIRGRRAREFFLNLAVVKGQHRLLEQLAAALESRGLEPVPGEADSWRVPGFEG